MKTVKLVDENVVGHVLAQLREGNKVTLVGLGTFRVTDCKARVGRNPKTNEPVDIPAKKKISFKGAKGVLA